MLADCRAVVPNSQGIGRHIGSPWRADGESGEVAADGADQNNLARKKRREERCPSCGYRPMTAGDCRRFRADLMMTWLHADPHRPGGLLERRHCARCQPHDSVSCIECAICGDGPLLTGPLTGTAPNPTGMPERLLGWLTAHDWLHTETIGWICGAHRQPWAATAESDPGPRRGS